MYRIKDFLNSKGYDTTNIELMQPYIKKWKSWYKNKVSDFHNYYIFNGERKVPMKRFSLGMAKKVCEDYANLLLNEKSVFKVGKNTENKTFNNLLDSNDFYSLANSGIEKTFATGTGAFVLGLNDIIYNEETEKFSFENANLKIEFVSAEKIYPLSYNGQKITECGFGVERVVDGTTLLYFTIHKKNEEGNYIIENYLFKADKKGNLTNISEKIEDSFLNFDTKNSLPWFSILKPGIENNLFDDSPFGIPIYANSIDVLKSTDIVFDSFVNEFILGKKRVAVKQQALKTDVIEGEIKRSFDPNDVVFYYMDVDDDEKSMIQDIDMKLRVEDLVKGIQFNLNLLSSKVTLGNDFYSFENNSVKTATEIISKNSDLFRNIHKHEIKIENCLYDLFKSICYIAKEFLGLPLNEDLDISIDFDDSIFEDKKEIKSTAIIELNNKLIGPIQYYMKVYNMTKKQAEAYHREVQKDIPQKETEVAEE